MTGSTINKIQEYLDELIPNPKCELNYNKDYELLIATMLSAQTTDKKVNQVSDKDEENYYGGFIPKKAKTDNDKINLNPGHDLKRKRKVSEEEENY